MATEILWYVPNVIGYVRILLALVAFILFWNSPFYFLLFYTTSVSLDFVDGYTARKLHQTSRFGAWLDVIVDLLGRGLLWCSLSRWGYFIIMFEWMTFISTHFKGPNWKETDTDYPAIVQKVMANGFHTPLGFITICGLHGLPIWIYAMQTDVFYECYIPVCLQYLVCVSLIAGRLLCFRVELFYNQKYIAFLLDEKPETKECIPKTE